MRFWLRAALAGLLFAVTSAACAPDVDLKTGLQILDVSTGWFDAGIVNGQNKLVPAISFKLKNVSTQKLSVIQVNVLFKRINDPAEWGSGFVTVVGSQGLAPGATTETVTVKSNLGYTGSDQTRQENEASHGGGSVPPNSHRCGLVFADALGGACEGPRACSLAGSVSGAGRERGMRPR